jgi:excisionase family DNA binding protein
MSVGDELLTRQQAAAALNCALITIDRYIRSGVIKSIKIGKLRRIKRREIERLLKDK